MPNIPPQKASQPGFNTRYSCLHNRRPRPWYYAISKILSFHHSKGKKASHSPSQSPWFPLGTSASPSPWESAESITLAPFPKRERFYWTTKLHNICALVSKNSPNSTLSKCIFIPDTITTVVLFQANRYTQFSCIFEHGT